MAHFLVSSPKRTMRRNLFVALVLLVIFSRLCPVCFSQAPTGAMAAYDVVQKQRGEAAKLWAQENASKEQIERGISILKSALLYLDDPLVKELARGNLYLKGR